MRTSINRTSVNQTRIRSKLALAFHLFLVAVVLFAVNVAQDAVAKTPELRNRGRTLVEAESYSAVSVEFPYAADAPQCSGKKYLGYYWGNSWFELQVEVAQMLNYSISLQAASPTGTKIEVEIVDSSGEYKSLTTIDIRNTGSWETYSKTDDATISLPAGVRTLRFRNVVDGANIDYITFTAGSDDDVVSIRPVANEGPDINPLKGFSSGWWRNEDYASVGFQYIEWGKFEPENDVFDWEYVETVLNRPGTKGRHFILQFVVDWDYRKPVDANYLGPDWLLKMVGERTGNADPDDSNSRPMRATRYNEPFFIDEASEAIKTLLHHYTDDPRTFVLQVGLLGFWGEWHTFPREDWSPTETTKRAVLNAYLNNLGPNGLTQVRYPDERVAEPQAGLGYTNGSATLTDHGREFGKAIARGQLWKNGPVGGEWPPNVERKHWENFFLSGEGRSFIEQAGYSTLLPPEPKEIAGKLAGWKQDDLFMKMHRRMGYNFQATTVRHLASVGKAGQTHIEVDLHNAGIAPFYKDWDVQLAILNAETTEVIDFVDIDTDLRTLGPTESTTIAGTVSAKIDPRMEYQIGIRIIQPHANETKTTPWSLNARNAYIVLANDVEVSEGVWDKEGALQGGWNILDVMERRQPQQAAPVEGRFFPFEGSFRPTE